MKRSKLIRISKNNSKYKLIDSLSLKSKNLYNYANYLIRQEFILNGKWIRYNELNKRLKEEIVYKELPIQTSQQTLMLLDKNWKSYFNSIKDWSKNKSKYSGKPKLPKYKKKDGRFNVVFTNQQAKHKNGIIKICPASLDLIFNINIENKIKQIQIIPKNNFYQLEIIYEIDKKEVELNDELYCGIDLGINNLITLTDNLHNNPIVINGKIIKSINQYYNKKRAEIQSTLLIKNKKTWSNKLTQLTEKRNNKIKDYMHKSSRYIINYCLSNKIKTIVIGYNQNWKERLIVSKQQNQNFFQIPYLTLIEMIQYKAEEYDIDVILTEESYTSKASFLDLDEMEKDFKFNGERIKRGLYKTNNGILINADVNGSYNIIRKVAPNVFTDGVEGVKLHPLKINFS
ncbi:transposase [Bacillus phage G]|uniref:Gp662 n=1 Tax=Bacillus phage G TaxID=2884420 RepID=G3MB42_9CAUD|nr:transposase [Bacillus phage G]AEO93905.1 gp662 [Bacillus phage G]